MTTTSRFFSSFCALSLFLFNSLPAANRASAPRFLPRTADSHTLDHLHQQSYLQQKSRNLRNEKELYPVEKARWDYWSMGLGIGLGRITRKDADGGTKYAGMPDVRLALERSFYLNPQWTLAFDISLLTPAIRLGCVIDENTRVSIGAHYWLIRRIEDMPDPFDQGNLAMHDPSREDMREKYDMVNPLALSPSVTVDHFISRNCFLRGALSYDRLLQYTKKGELRSKWHWPQLTVTMNFQF